MKIKLLLLFLIIFLFKTDAQTLPNVTAGKIERIENFTSKFVTARNIDVWLPKGYSTQKRYAVLYMHDGQMLFDTNTWNKQTWNADEVATKLIAKQKVQNFIVVGIWNDSKNRHADYFPQKPYESIDAVAKTFVVTQLQNAGRGNEHFKPNSDNYLNFLVTELKPIIDKKYAVYTDKSHTFIAGSSMGGLISLYAICEYPHVFGGAACLSTHWLGIFTAENNPIPQAFYNYLAKQLPSPSTHKIYFDYGDQTLDSLYPPLQRKVDKLMNAKGFTPKTWVTRFFAGNDHSENSWSKRLDIPLLFLLRK